MKSSLVQRGRFVLVGSALLSLMACQADTTAHSAFPMAQVARFDQPVPKQAVLGQPYLSERGVLPQAETPPAQALPMAVPLHGRPSLADLLLQAQSQSDATQVAVQQALSVQGSGWAGQVSLLMD